MKKSLLLLVLIVCFASSYGQNSFALQGSIYKYESNWDEPIDSAKVTIVEDKKLSFSTYTDKNGFYVFERAMTTDEPYLKHGHTYEIVVEKIGYITATGAISISQEVSTTFVEDFKLERSK